MEEHKALKPGNGELQAALDEWMEEWEAEEERKRQEALRAQEDDGWTVVQRHKASGACGGGQVGSSGMSVFGAGTARCALRRYTGIKRND